MSKTRIRTSPARQDSEGFPPCERPDRSSTPPGTQPGRCASPFLTPHSDRRDSPRADIFPPTRRNRSTLLPGAWPPETGGGAPLEERHSPPERRWPPGGGGRPPRVGDGQCEWFFDKNVLPGGGRPANDVRVSGVQGHDNEPVHLGIAENLVQTRRIAAPLLFGELLSPRFRPGETIDDFTVSGPLRRARQNSRILPQANKSQPRFLLCHSSVLS